MKRLLHTLLSLSLVLAFTASVVPTANAVVQNVTVVGPGGDPIGRQTVTIHFPPGVTDADGKSSAEAETDEDGGLIFNFPGDGEYRIDHAGGSMTVEVKGGIPTWIKVAGGIFGVGALVWAIDDNDNNNNNSTQGGQGGTQGGQGGTQGGQGGTQGGQGGTQGGQGGTQGGQGGTQGGQGGTQGGQNGGNVDGTYDTVTFVVTSNPANHPPGPFQSARYTVTKNLDTGAIQIIVEGDGASATLSGTCDENGNFTVTGSGMYAGFNTTFSMSGTFQINGNTVTFTISGGDDGGLPMGQPIVGDGTAEK